jgi:hypothetical protein
VVCDPRYTRGECRQGRPAARGGRVLRGHVGARENEQPWCTHCRWRPGTSDSAARQLPDILVKPQRKALPIAGDLAAIMERRLICAREVIRRALSVRDHLGPHVS